MLIHTTKFKILGLGRKSFCASCTWGTKGSVITAKQTPWMCPWLEGKHLI